MKGIVIGLLGIDVATFAALGVHYGSPIGLMLVPHLFLMIVVIISLGEG